MFNFSFVPLIILIFERILLTEFVHGSKQFKALSRCLQQCYYKENNIVY